MKRPHVFCSEKLIRFLAFLDVTFGARATTTSGTTPRDLPKAFSPVTPTSTSTPTRVTLRSRGQQSTPPPSSTSSFSGGDVYEMPGKKAGGGGGAGGKTPVDGSPHPAGGSPSNTRVSHNTEAVPRGVGLGTVGKHGLRRSTSNPNCEAVLWDAGLGAVGKHGHSSSTSNPSTPPRSGGVGTNKFTVSGSSRPLRAERKAKADKLQILLYPHPDLLADFKSSAGRNFQPH